MVLRAKQPRETWETENLFLLLKIRKREVKASWAPLFQHLAEHVDAPQLASSFEATVNKFDKNFSAHLLDLLARLSLYSTSDCEHSMASVISRCARGPGFPRRLPATLRSPDNMRVSALWLLLVLRHPLTCTCSLRRVFPRVCGAMSEG